MKLGIAAFTLIACALVSSAQLASREQKLAEIKDLNSKIDKIVDELLSPSADDLKQAEALGLHAIRINPREVYGRIAVPQEGGAFYSFSTGSHDYQKTSQILLEQGYLSSGFAGADYGFIADLGQIPLAEVDRNIPAIDYVLRYQAPGNILDARVEQRRSRDFAVGDAVFRSRVKPDFGHTYVLRAISFGRADIAVAFQPVRKDSDGSLILFWKMISELPRPELDRNIKENL